MKVVIEYVLRQLSECPKQIHGAGYVLLNKSNGPYTSSARIYSTHRERSFISSRNKILLAVWGISVGGGIFIYYKGWNLQLQSIISNKSRANDLPLYTVEEVARHASPEDRIWVTYKDGVYDITDFVDKHPGGDNILLAAGSAVDPFWMTYSVHKHPDIIRMLEKYKIGYLKDGEDALDVSDPYANDPKRSSILKVNCRKPFNAETPLPLLVNDFITSSESFYIRNHLPVPEIDEESYSLAVCGVGMKEFDFTLNDIKNKFPKATTIATIQCAGNRRSEVARVKPVKGLSWDGGAIGNAVWSGALLRDVLQYCGVPSGNSIKHVQFEGLDTDPTNNPYGASIPIEKALDPKADVLLAYEMNGEPLSRDHGFPVRVIVPGVIGARNVKWLGKIYVSDEESQSFWQQNDYKAFAPSVDWDTVDFKTAPAIQEAPVTSAICSPSDGQKVKLHDGKITVKGYAWSGGGRKVVRVDVTTDGGKMWLPAKIVQEEKEASLTRCWSWVLWQVDIPITGSPDRVEIWSKAVDSAYNIQPESFQNIWNLRGVLGNAYHRISVKIIP